MTPLATDDRRVICRIQLTGEGRWVSLALSLNDRAPVTQFLVSADDLRYEVAGADEGARVQPIQLAGGHHQWREVRLPRVESLNPSSLFA